jgi:hypothetical protein
LSTLYTTLSDGRPLAHHLHRNRRVEVALLKQKILDVVRPLVQQIVVDRPLLVDRHQQLQRLVDSFTPSTTTFTSGPWFALKS